MQTQKGFLFGQKGFDIISSTASSDETHANNLAYNSKVLVFIQLQHICHY